MQKFALVVAALVAAAFSSMSSNGQQVVPPPGDAGAFTENFAKLCREAAPNLKLKVVGPLSLQADTAQGEVDGAMPEFG